MVQEKDVEKLNKLEEAEWLDAIDDIIDEDGASRAQQLLDLLIRHVQHKGLNLPFVLNSPYCNTIPQSLETNSLQEEDQLMMPRICALIRWNAVIMVLNAGKHSRELGGHIATYASSALLYEVGFNYFFKGPKNPQGADLVFIQGHSSPGIYARAFLEGRLTHDELTHFRREAFTQGLSSYPHPWLMDEFWQFATVSMGLGPMQAIYTARFLKYLENRNIKDTSARKVWAFLGDGETDEPESLGALSIAARENLDNLIFVVNCNLQRLDGPVRGNGKIIQELERIFKGAGWNVIKVIWGRRWDPLFAKDTDGRMQQRMDECLDGEYQAYKANDGAFVREYFFGVDPVLKERVANMTDEEIWRLNRGGHDLQKVFTAYEAAVKHKGQPTVILAKTIKGYGMGAAGEGQNITHQQKKMTIDQLKIFRDRFKIPLSDDEVNNMPFYKPDLKSPEIQFILKHREKLGGFLPYRNKKSDKLAVPSLNSFASLLEGTQDREVSTTMSFVRMLGMMLKDKNIGPRIVPIVPDESRTFGMEGLFRQIGIYSPHGQLYTPVDHSQLMSYYEAKDGQLLEEGINEAGAFCSWLAAGTAYSHTGVTMIPFYIYYSMFGFQRIGDFAWAAGDMQARGFLLGATAGRTTLAGEGLQHQDGHSHILASTIPNCVAYDPAFAYELIVIIQHGLKRMLEDEENIFYYLTIMNENYKQPPMPKGVEKDIIGGMYLLTKAKNPKKYHVQLLGSGSILREVIEAGRLLEQDYSVSADIWSVTSFTELYKEAQSTTRQNRLNPKEKPKLTFVENKLNDTKSPVIAATDYIRLHADQIRAFVKAPYVVLGTDGYGRSDTREALRSFFEVDAYWIVYTALETLAKERQLDMAIVEDAMKKYKIAKDKPDPLKV
ncbi:MAG: pyruvate dehydrogenase (acetyl-transferring), homodimeric type [Legionellales bacterium RIFCSPHIGHO2_12_FULL_37_14]|nr:MAG: pyruvate dehydrogenase (acetyl-transferring), homodimeric type [Legionellales bacterium RIFCSPHIGHO2_12_FULL_37_14]